MRCCAALLGLALITIGGCGQKGPLYLPQPDRGEAVQEQPEPPIPAGTELERDRSGSTDGSST